MRYRLLAIVLGSLALGSAACQSVAVPSSKPPAAQGRSHASTVGVNQRSTADKGGAPVTASVCPKKWSYSNASSSLNPNPKRSGLAQTLVPAGPVYLTVCRYAGLDSSVPAGSLENEATFSARTVSDFVRYVDGPSFKPVSSSTYFCPMSEGQVDLLRFVYPTGPQVVLSVDTDGCEFVSNGSRTVSGGSIAKTVTAWVGSDGA